MTFGIMMLRIKAFGIISFSIMTFGIMTLTIRTFSIMPLSITSFGIVAFSIMTLVRNLKLDTMTLRMIDLIATLSMNDTQQVIIMLSVVLLSYAGCRMA